MAHTLKKMKSPCCKGLLEKLRAIQVVNISRTLWKMTVRYHVQKSQGLNSILKQLNLVHRVLSYFFKTDFIIVLHLHLYVQCILFLSYIPSSCSLYPSDLGQSPPSAP
jgi:hypothetical protein